MNEVIVRRAKREDCKAIRALVQELADFEEMSDGPKIDYKTLEKDGFDAEHPLFICYVATNKEKVIGYAVSCYIYSTWVGKSMYLEDLYVTPEFRKQHVGSKLFKTMAKEAVDNNCNRFDFVVLNWNPAQEFYNNKGAVDITTKEGWHVYRLTDSALKTLASDA